MFLNGCEPPLLEKSPARRLDFSWSKSNSTLLTCFVLAVLPKEPIRGCEFQAAALGDAVADMEFVELLQYHIGADVLKRIRRQCSISVSIFQT